MSNISAETVLWLMSLILSLFLLVTKWVDTTKAGSNLGLSCLSLMYTCLLSNSLWPSKDLTTAAAFLGLTSLVVWSLQKLAEGMEYAQRTRF